MYGAPDSKNPDDDFSNFESCLIEHRGTMNMTSLFGRVRFVRILMVTGNRDGLCGYTLLKAPFGTGIRALRRAVNRAGNRVCFIDRYTYSVSQQVLNSAFAKNPRKSQRAKCS